MSSRSPDSKNSLRAAMRSQLRAREAEASRTESAAICAWLRPRVAVGTVAAFFPLPGEVDLRPLLQELAAAGRLALPRVGPQGLSLHRVGDLAGLSSGPLGLREPDAAAPRLAASELSVVLVPGLAFTLRGERLGRGKGYYDRLLADLPPRAATIGVGFACQLLAALPLESHDICLKAVVPPLAGRAC
jgi:5-formyltetrahydrofolate cyclo-ligase